MDHAGPIWEDAARVQINRCVSQLKKLHFSGPQAPFLGTVLFTMFSAPVGDILRKHGLGYHITAGDTGMYSLWLWPCGRCCHAWTACAVEIGSWIRSNMLKLSEDKTNCWSYSEEPFLSIPRGDHRGQCESLSQAGVHSGRHIWSTHDYIKAHISWVYSTVYGHLRNIGYIRRHLTEESAASPVLSMVTARLLR